MTRARLSFTVVTDARRSLRCPLPRGSPRRHSRRHRLRRSEDDRVLAVSDLAGDEGKPDAESDARSGRPVRGVLAAERATGRERRADEPQAPADQDRQRTRRAPALRHHTGGHGLRDHRRGRGHAARGGVPGPGSRDDRERALGASRRSLPDPDGPRRAGVLVNVRAAPYNLFTSAANQRDNLKKLKAETANDIPRWGFLVSQDHPATIAGMNGGVPATEIAVPYRADTSAVTYQYDAATKTYARFQNSAGRAVRDIDAVTNKPVAATDVVIIQTEIWEVQDIVDAAGAFSNDMRMTGTGPASVFRDGLRQDGTWSRKDDLSPFVFKNAAGEQILLSPGQPWIHVVPNDMKVTSQ